MKAYLLGGKPLPAEPSPASPLPLPIRLTPPVGSRLRVWNQYLAQKASRGRDYRVTHVAAGYTGTLVFVLPPMQAPPQQWIDLKAFPPSTRISKYERWVLSLRAPPGAVARFMSVAMSPLMKFEVL